MPESFRNRLESPGDPVNLEAFSENVVDKMDEDLKRMRERAANWQNIEQYFLVVPDPFGLGHEEYVIEKARATHIIGDAKPCLRIVVDGMNPLRIWLPSDEDADLKVILSVIKGSRLVEDINNRRSKRRRRA